MLVYRGKIVELTMCTRFGGASTEIVLFGLLTKEKKYYKNANWFLQSYKSCSANHAIYVLLSWKQEFVDTLNLSYLRCAHGSEEKKSRILLFY
jgi:hypothetical protein